MGYKGGRLLFRAKGNHQIVYTERDEAILDANVLNTASRIVRRHGAWMGAAIAYSFLSNAQAAAAPADSWSEIVSQLAQERSQAKDCVELLRSTGDRASILQGRIAYGHAKAAIDGVVAGLTIVLVQGGNPSNVATMDANLDRAGTGLKVVCDEAIKAALADSTRGSPVSDAVSAAIGPAFDLIKSGVSALWNNHVQAKKGQTDAIKKALADAKWPEFGS